jgi:hypothetical protein
MIRKEEKMTNEFHNPYPWDDDDEAYAEKYTFERDAVLFLGCARGQYIPRDFADQIKRDCVTGVSQRVWEILESGPDNEEYWDAWINVESNAVITDPSNGIEYRVYQNDDCWLVPTDCEIPEDF